MLKIAMIGADSVLDRHTASVLSIQEIRAMVDDLIAAHGAALPAGIRRRSECPMLRTEEPLP